jgi:hypothetical protein
VPETLAGAGVLVDDRSPAVLASAVHRVVSDPALAGALAARGRRRVEELGLGPSEERLRRAISAILAAAGLRPTLAPVSAS